MTWLAALLCRWHYRFNPHSVCVCTKRHLLFLLLPQYVTSVTHSRRWWVIPDHLGCCGQSGSLVRAKKHTHWADLWRQHLLLWSCGPAALRHLTFGYLSITCLWFKVSCNRRPDVAHHQYFFLFLSPFLKENARKWTLKHTYRERFGEKGGVA